MATFAETVDREVTLEKMTQKRGSQKWNTYDPDVIPLHFCSPDYPVPPEADVAATRAVQDGCYEYAHFPETTEAMAETTTAKYGIAATPEDVMVVPGVMPSLWLSTMYAYKPGDEVILPSMIFGPFIRAVNYIGAKAVYHELSRRRTGDSISSASRSSSRIRPSSSSSATPTTPRGGS